MQNPSWILVKLSSDRNVISATGKMEIPEDIKDAMGALHGLISSYCEIRSKNSSDKKYVDACLFKLTSGIREVQAVLDQDDREFPDPSD